MRWVAKAVFIEAEKIGKESLSICLCLLFPSKKNPWRKLGNIHTIYGMLYNHLPPGSLALGTFLNQEVAESHKINIACISCQICWCCTAVLHHISSISWINSISKQRACVNVSTQWCDREKYTEKWWKSSVDCS